MKKLEFLEKARSVHGYKYRYPNLPNKLTLQSKVGVEFNDQIFYQTVSKHLMGRSPERVIQKKTTEDFIKESKEIWGEKYDYSLTEYTGALNLVKVIYNGIVYEQRATSHLLGLAPEFRYNEESLIRKKIKDSDDKGMKEIFQFLVRHKIKFQEMRNLGGFQFQFYLQDIRTVIEFWSNLHSTIKEIDKAKEVYCEEHFINLIVITQFDEIHNILYQNLIKNI